MQRAGGNTAFALLTAVGTNILALATLPLVAGPLLGPLLPPGVAMPLPFVICCALFRLCVLPLAAGVAARRCSKSELGPSQCSASIVGLRRWSSCVLACLLACLPPFSLCLLLWGHAQQEPPTMLAAGEPGDAAFRVPLNPHS